MTTYSWSAARTKAIDLFKGYLPHQDTEDDCIAAFETNPAHVLQLIDDIGAKVAAGQIRSGWAILHRSVNDTAAARRDVTITVDDQAKQLRLAEAWIRNTGIHYDRADEIEDELFGDRGRLKPWADDTDLRHRITQLWRDQRPRGETVEAEELERAAKWKADMKRIRKTKRLPSAT